MPDARTIKDLGQYFTPAWAAERLVECFFDDLRAGDVVCEPSCGDGRFLQVFPEDLEAFGVEIDPVHAAAARRRTGREVITGDFRTAALPVADGEVDAVIGNPPYKMGIVDGMLDRAHRLLGPRGRIGFVLPAYTFQTPSRVLRYAEDWRLEVTSIPRTLFPGIKLPLVFAQFKKEGRQWVGLALYEEAEDVAHSPAAETLRSGSGSVWKEAVFDAIEALGGEADLSEIYAALAPRRPTGTQWWREKVRQVAARALERTGPGRYALPMQQAA